MAHVVNLIVQALLHAMEEADNPDVNDYFKSTKDSSSHYNIDEDSEQMELDKEKDIYDGTEVGDDIELDDKEREVAGQSPLKRVCVYAIAGSYYIYYMLIFNSCAS